MSISDDIKSVLTADTTLMALLTGSVHNDVEEISLVGTPTAFNSTTKEIKPCALIKLGVETRIGPFIHSVQTPVVIYFYQFSGYDTIEPAMSRVYGLLHNQKIGSSTWRVKYESSVHHQRDDPLNCALMTMRFTAVRSRESEEL